MSRKTVLIGLCLGLLWWGNVLASEVKIELNSPNKSMAKAITPRPILEPIEVSGNLIIDITPYPNTVEEERYLAEYFLDGQLIYQTTGYNSNNPEELTFHYLLDTTRFLDGQYKIIVNFWDKDGPSAIGIREIVIKNTDG